MIGIFLINFNIVICKEGLKFYKHIYMSEDEMHSVNSIPPPKHDIFDQMIEEKSISLTPSQAKRAMAQVTALVKQVSQMRQQSHRRQQQSHRRQSEAYRMMEKILLESKEREQKAYRRQDQAQRMMQKILLEAKNRQEQSYLRGKEQAGRRHVKVNWKDNQSYSQQRQLQGHRMYSYHHELMLKDKKLLEQSLIEEKNRQRSRQTVKSRKTPTKSALKQTKVEEWIQKVKLQRALFRQHVEVYISAHNNSKKSFSD